MDTRIYRSRYRLIGGVIGGIANRFGLHPTLLRIIALLLLWVPHLNVILVILYLLGWLLLPVAAPGWERSYPPLFGRLRRSRRERMLSGLLGGVAWSWSLPVAAVRIGWVVLTVLTVGLGVPLYLLLWIAVPLEER